MRYIDVSGQRFGKLICLVKVGTTKKSRNAIWLCKCDCGNEIKVSINSLKTKKTQSCGCLQKEKASVLGKEATKHGMVNTKVYKVWSHMKARCLNKHDKSYINYGARGIKVCDDWMTFSKFHEWAINNSFEEHLTIERKNVDGDYEPSNCKWATKLEQANNKRNNVKVTINGDSKNITQWAKELRININTVYSRIKSGWEIEKALLTPVTKRKGVNKS